MRFYNIAVRPGDHAPFLETHGNSVGLGRSVVDVCVDIFGCDIYRIVVGLSICKMMMVCYDCMCMNWRLFDRVVCLVMYVCLVVLCFTTHASSCALSRFLVICKHITNIGPKPAAAGPISALWEWN